MLPWPIQCSLPDTAAGPSTAASPEPPGPPAAALAGERAIPLRPPSYTASASRLVVNTGLVVSAFLLLVAYLDRDGQRAAIFGSLTVIFFLVWLRQSRRT